MKTILVPVDFSDATAGISREAVRLARAFAANIVMVHIAAPEPEFVGYDAGPPSVRSAVARDLAEEHRRLHELTTSLDGQGVQVTALVFQGYPVEKILAEAEKWDVDLIVMGSHGHGILHNLLVGSVTDGVLRRATCPVLVVPVRPPSAS